MDQSDKNWTLSATLLAGAGASLVLVGLYFLFLRPALLPEDVRFMAISEEQMASVGPQLLGSSFKCNTHGLQGIGCCDGQTKQAPQQRGTWRDFGRA